MGQKTTITALIVTYNAERFICGCLESLKWVDEIIVMDMFSTDRTIEIALKYTDKIIQDKEENAEARTNLGIDRASSDWILKILATERITDALKVEIIKRINSNENFEGYHIPRKNYFYGRFIKEKPGPLYLFKKGAGKYPCISGHEKIAIKGKVGRLKNFKIHYSAITIREIIDKGNTYTSNDAKAVFAGHPRAFGGCKLPVYRANLYHLLYRPLWGFFAFYTIGKGYKYGMHGLIIALFSIFWNFIEIAKLWELQYKKKHNIKDELIPED